MDIFQTSALEVIKTNSIKQQLCFLSPILCEFWNNHKKKEKKTLVRNTKICINSKHFALSKWK